MMWGGGMTRFGAVVGVWLSWCMMAEVWAFSASYDQKITRGNQVVTAKVTLRDDRFRMEATVEGGTMVTIRNSEGIYTYMPQEGMAMKLPMLDPSQQPVQNADNYQAYLRQQQAQFIGSEVIKGYSCDVYRFADSMMRGTTTAWVWQEKQFPVRLEIDAPDGKTVIEFANVQLGILAPDSAFQLPPGVQVMDMGSMMQMPQQADQYR